jgi:hypothetical protein
MSALRRGLASWRELGPRAGTTALVRLARERARGPLRRVQLWLRPPRVDAAALSRALGGADPAQALRERALPALPTVAKWESELEQLDGDARARLLAQAERIVAHRFDLLGSGPSDLGPTIDWQRDFKSGRRWPQAHISRLAIVLGDGSDVKLPWELSRCQHLPVLSAAYRVSGEDRFLDELGAQLISFIAANPIEHGVNWACTMDVAIRAANWTAALCMATPDARRAAWLEPALASLLLHCRFIRAHLEWGEVRGNHYLSDVVGLLVAAAPFSVSEEGRSWVTWATGELEREVSHQVRADGCDHEASISYHRLVAELFVCGAQAADALRPGSLSEDFHARLDRMLGFVADYTRPDGLAPQIGDADDGRFLPLGSYGAEQRDHRHLRAQAGRPSRGGVGHAAYADGGWYVMRHGELWCIVRCGDVGLGGVGAHAHNDQLSFELARGGQPLLVDPGSYLYTADARARNAFRSTAAHCTLAIGGAEQNRLRSDYLFALPEETRARCVRFETDGPHALFEGEHTGFHALARSVRHRRELRFDAGAGVVRITDTVFGGSGEELVWSFPLAPGQARATGTGVLATFAGGALEIAAEGASLEVESGWIAPSYGVRLAAPVVRARRTARFDEDVTRFTLATRGPERG